MGPVGAGIKKACPPHYSGKERQQKTERWMKREVEKETDRWKDRKAILGEGEEDWRTVNRDLADPG